MPRTGGSLSARRAWIEIVEFHLFASSGVVALRKESVDRNKNTLQYEYYNSVALRKESVDRNKHITETMKQMTGRSPQGERG